LDSNQPLAAAIANLYDINRDGQVDALDQSAARQFGRFPYGQLDLINVPAAGGGSASAAVASALASSTVATVSSSSVAPDAGLIRSQQPIELAKDSFSAMFAQLAVGDSRGANAIAKSAEHGANLELDDAMLDALISGLTMQRNWEKPKAGA